MNNTSTLPTGHADNSFVTMGRSADGHTLYRHRLGRNEHVSVRRDRRSEIHILRLTLDGDRLSDILHQQPAGATAGHERNLQGPSSPDSAQHPQLPSNIKQL